MTATDFSPEIKPSVASPRIFELRTYTVREGGGNIKGLITALEHVIVEYPADTKVIPGHGQLATMRDLEDYVGMLKETVAAVEAGLQQHKPAEELQALDAVVHLTSTHTPAVDE